jgi:hypothetical protein
MEDTNKPSGIRNLTEEEINLDLKRNFSDYNPSMRLEDLVNIKYAPSPRTKEGVIRNYNTGYHLREFLNNEDVKLSFSAREIMPVVFTPVISVVELNDIAGYNRSRGLDNIENMKIVELSLISKQSICRKILIKINDFETIRDGIVSYASEQKYTKKKELGEKFGIELGMLKDDIDKISSSTAKIFEEFEEWYDGIDSNPHFVLRKFMKMKRANEAVKTEVKPHYETTVTETLK